MLSEWQIRRKGSFGRGGGLIEEDEGLFEYLKRVVLEGSVGVQTEAADYREEQEDEDSNDEGGHQDYPPEGVNEVRH